MDHFVELRAGLIRRQLEVAVITSEREFPAAALAMDHTYKTIVSDLDKYGLHSDLTC